MKSDIKIANYSWWICGVLGLFIGLMKADQRFNDPGMMAFAGIANGVFWGWLLGYIIDKIKDSNPIHNISQKIEEVKQEREIVTQTKNSLNEYNDARHRFQYLSKETLIEKYKSYVTDDLTDMQRLALEEELVKRGVLSHSPMHEKLEKIKEHLKL